MSNAVRDALMRRVHQSLRCPGCHLRLAHVAGNRDIRCHQCHVTFPVLPGEVPVLLLQDRRAQFANLLSEDEGGVRMAQEYSRYGTWRGKLRNALKPPSIVYDVDVARKYSWIYDTQGEATLILSIGGGPGRENPRVINLNVDAFDSVDIIGDGTNIPLVDGSVDTVTCNAVIEHVSNPADLLSEMYRVLAPGGYAQLMVPFVFPFHAYPSDYQRYSTMGILELTRSFDKIELCVLTGPTSAMAVLFREYLRLLVPGGNGRFLRPVLNGISGWLTFPIKYLDLWLNRKPEAANMSAAFYYLGRKPSA
jgi:SAM-dependent methyltransferase